MSCEIHPRVHYADTPHSPCLIGLTAPADCSRGCAGYLADIARRWTWATPSITAASAGPVSWVAARM